MLLLKHKDPMAMPGRVFAIPASAGSAAVAMGFLSMTLLLATITSTVAFSTGEYPFQRSLHRLDTKVPFILPSSRCHQGLLRGSLISSFPNIPAAHLLRATTKEESAEDASSSTPFVQSNLLIRETARLLRRSSWFSWWSQVILTVIAAVILLFAQSVGTVSTASGVVAPMRNAGGTFFLSGVGLLISAASIVWTWGNGSRLSRRLLVKPTSTIAAAQMVRRAIRVGVLINLCGLLCHLLAAQQIVGSLAIKVLTRGGGLGGGGAGLLMGPAAASLLDGAVQPLDILIVQANANQLLAQFCSLVSLLYMTGNVEKLDPPSTEESPRLTKVL
jgi:Protein of unknown function (DUF3611)